MSNENNRENMDNQQPEKPTTSPTTKPEKFTTDSENRDPKMCETTTSDKLQTSEKNTGVVIKNIESASLNSLLVYDSDSSSSSEMMKLNLNWQVRNDSDESSSTSSSSSSDDDDDDSDTTTEDDEPSPAISNPSQNRGAIRKKVNAADDGELSLDRLPPVPDLANLNINVENESFVHMGNVLGIVDKLVTIAALPNTPAYDLDTLLFLDNGKRPLGFVFDVLGQVTSPIYAIRFNSVDDIKNLQIQVGTKVYSAPTSKHTQYVFLQQLLKMKGTDASWMDDAEVPPEFADFSDDENEAYQRFGTKKLSPHVKRTHSSDNYKKFESTMNRKNLLNTKFNKYMDSYKQARLNRAKAKRPPAPHINTSVPAFDPSIPPPNMVPHLGYYHHYVPQELMGVYYDAGSGGENNNSGTSQSQGYAPNLFMNNFVANLSQTNSANYFTNHAGNNHPGPSHE
jgi:rRNA processing protein Gar1